ncbi:MAG: enoyl-CoA hydratase/isomerase family protein [Hyphomicrobiaceae bacterium]
MLTFNRDSALNAVSRELAREVAATLIRLDDDDNVNGIVLTGAGTRAFCAGVDLREGREIEVAEVEDWFGAVCNIYRQILLTEKPVIAAINGVAAGAGFQIALVSDLRIAAPNAKLGQPEINAGIPSIMGSYWMSLHLGWSLNQELSFTGRLMDADEAAALRLVNRIVPADELVPAAVEVAREFAAKPATAWRRTKQRFREVAMRGFDDAFRAGVLGQQEAFARGEPQAIMEAFLQSRKAKK